MVKNSNADIRGYPHRIRQSHLNHAKMIRQRRRNPPTIKKRIVKMFKKIFCRTKRIRNKRTNGLDPTFGVNLFCKQECKDSNSTDKRIIVVDGNNVAHGYSNPKKFAVEGIDIVLKFFEKRGHKTKIVVPSVTVQESDNCATMKRLYKENKLILGPGKDSSQKQESTNNDRLVLKLAVKFDAAVISNNKFRDLAKENAAFKKIIENQVIGFVFFKEKFMLPLDPYGKNGPKLDNILNRRN